MTDNNKYHNGYVPHNEFRGNLNYQNNAAAQHEDEIDLKELFYTLWSSKWVILGSVIIGGILALFIAFLQTPLYLGEGTMIIKESKSASSLASAFNGGLSSLLGSNSGPNLGNEMKILNSRTLSEGIAEKLIENPLMQNGRMYPVLWKDWPEDSVVISKRDAGSRIKSNIKYERLEGSSIIEIKYESPSPYEAAYIVNLAMETYKEQSIEQSLDLSGSTADFLNSEQAELKDSLNRAEVELEQYMDRSGIVQLDAQTQQQISQYASMTSQRYEAQVQLESVNASINEYQKRLNELKPGLAEKLANAIGPKVNNLQFQVSELETKRALIYSNNPNLSEDDPIPPEIENINSRIESLKERIKEEAENLLQSNDEFLGFLGENSSSVIGVVTGYSKNLIDRRIDKLRYEAQIDVLTEQIREKEQFLENVPENQLRLTRLKRNVQVQEELYLLITKQLAQTNITAKAEMGNSRPLDKAIVPLGPSKPILWLYLLIGLAAGGFLALVYIGVTESLDSTITKVKPLKNMQLRVLSVIPFFDSTDRKYSSSNNHSAHDLILVSSPESSAALAFRRLANKIIYTDPAKSIQSLMVTSPNRSEGTTTVVSNLATALAKANAKVIAVDINLEQPDLHLAFERSAKPGLADAIINQENLDDLIQKTNIPGVDLLSAGNFTQSISGLIKTPSFKKVLSSLESSYDYILFDVPPIGLNSDALGLAKLVDTTVINTRFGKTQKPEVEFILEELNNINASVLGTVLNAYKKGKTPESSSKAYLYEIS